MDVEAEAGADGQLACQPGLRASEILLVGDLGEHRIPRHRRDGDAGGAGDLWRRRSPRRLARPGARRGSPRNGRPAASGRGRASRAAPPPRAGRPLWRSYRLPAAQEPRRHARRAPQQAIDNRGGNERAGGVMDEDSDRGSSSGERLEAVQHRLAPLGAARRPGRAGDGPPPLRRTDPPARRRSPLGSSRSRYAESASTA